MVNRPVRGRLLAVSVVLSVVAVLLTACSSGSSSPPAAASPSQTVWLCRPGTANDPCQANLDATVVNPDGTHVPQSAKPATNPRFDCFYIYPTVSRESGDNANLQIQPAETFVALEQASRFSQVCRVWAPMYRQATDASLADGHAIEPAVANTAYDSLLAAWRDYLAHDNDGRPVVLIGHSQGASILIKLLQSQVDPNPQLRSQMVSAIALGGNVTVPQGKTVGGSFQHVPACTSTAQTHCIIAYSSFLSPPPANTLFGVPGQGVSVLSGQTAKAGLQVLCVNPAAIGSTGSAPLDPYLATPATNTSPASWVTYPDLYTASCSTSGNTTWLQVNDVGGPNDHRPRVTESLGPTWGLHLYDVNIALGNLVNDVHQQELAYHAGS
jgi:hypothetical protein